LNTLKKQLWLLVLVFALGLAAPSATLAVSATIGMPFTGKWAYNADVKPPYTDSNSSHPSVHQNYYGDWATDIYAAEGVPVKLHVSSSDGVLSFYWISRTSGLCGQRTVIGVKVNGVDVGSVYYEHLNSAVTSGVITNGMTVGTVHSWGVCNPGPHVHIELKNSSGYACYLDKGNPGVTVQDEDLIGVLGSPNNGSKQPCATIPGSGTISGVGTRMVGDVNGDGKADAVVMYRDSGTAFVALSNGSSAFGPVQTWAAQHTVGADKYFLGDVNGDGRADLVAFWNDVGRWRVNLSSGSGFWSEQEWAYGQGANTNNQFVADVNGDGKADAVTFDTVNGDWYASLSTGTGFGPNQQLWAHGHGAGSSDQFLADFDGDMAHKADVAFYYSSVGAWYVGISSGSGFWTPNQWSANHGLSSDKRVVGDVNGDGKADTGYFFTSLGHWDVGLSAGSGFYAPTAWAANQGNNTTDQFFADVSGDGKADFISYDNGAGDWRVSISSGSGFWAPSLWLSGMGKGS
jgi:hypothetical protein